METDLPDPAFEAVAAALSRVPGLAAMSTPAIAGDLAAAWPEAVGSHLFLLVQERRARPKAKGAEARAGRSNHPVVAFTGAVIQPGQGLPRAFTGVVASTGGPAASVGAILAEARRLCTRPDGAPEHGTLSTGLRRLGVMRVEDALMPASADGATPNVTDLAAHVARETGLAPAAARDWTDRWLDDAGLSAVRARIPPRAVTALRMTRDYGIGALEHYCAEGEAADIRREVASAFPTFADTMRDAAYVSGEAEGVAAAFAGFASGGRGAVPTAGHLRAMRRARWDWLGMDGKRALLNMLFRLPSNWFPETPSESRAAWLLRGAWSELDLAGCDPREVLAGAGTGWERLAARVSKAIAPSGLDHLPRLLTDVSNEMGRRLVLPCLAHSMPDSVSDDCGISRVESRLGRVAGRALYGGLSLTACVETQRLWHAHVRPPPQRGFSLSWTAMTGAWRHDSGLSVVPLSDSASLMEEGQAMSHCVASYAWSCYAGGCQIVSVRTDDGKSLSTAELDVRRSGRPLVRQHRGMRNGQPAREAEAALSSYLDAIAGGQLAVAADALARADELGRPRAPGVATACGFDWRDGDALRARVAEYDAILPARMRGRTPAEWADFALGVLGRQACAKLLGPARGWHQWPQDVALPLP